MLYSLEFANYIEPILDIIILILSIIICAKWKNRDSSEILYQNETNIKYIILLCLVLSIVIGLRPLPNNPQCDAVAYANRFNIIKHYGALYTMNEEEWGFRWLMIICSKLGDVYFFFFIVTSLYILLPVWGIYRIFRNNTSYALLFYFCAFSFYNYAVNGIRNGLACAIMILALSYVLLPKHRNWIVAGFLSFLAMVIHKSCTLPVVCFLAAYFIKNTRFAVGFWIFSIFLYLTLRGPIESFFAGLGFDDRLTGYINSGASYASSGLKSGFRIDFLIYSAMPIWLGWDVNKRLHGQTGQTFRLLLNTYIYANAFWVMLMGAAYSNRFAYLSWFLYPIVLAYPCLRMNVWGSRQGKISSTILFAHSAFTVFMSLIYYGAIFRL